MDVSPQHMAAMEDIREKFVPPMGKVLKTASWFSCGWRSIEKNTRRMSSLLFDGCGVKNVRSHSL
jgi:hypothetical protein